MPDRACHTKPRHAVPSQACLTGPGLALTNLTAPATPCLTLHLPDPTLPNLPRLTTFHLTRTCLACHAPQRRSHPTAPGRSSPALPGLALTHPELPCLPLLAKPQLTAPRTATTCLACRNLPCLAVPHPDEPGLPYHAGPSQARPNLACRNLPHLNPPQHAQPMSHLTMPAMPDRDAPRKARPR